MGAPLSAQDIDQFVELGFCAVRRAIPGAVVDEVLASVRGSAEEERASWWMRQRSVYYLPVLAAALSEPVRGAFDQLAGPGEWHLAASWGFPVRGGGPLPPKWHIDGDWFTHHVDSGEQILTPIFLWQDVTENDGPTLLAPGSHRDVARLLAEAEPKGVPGERILDFINGRIRPRDVVKATGEAGDVIICHPFLVHSTDTNGAQKPRYISNVAVHGRRPMRTDLTAGETSPVELPIAQALQRYGAAAALGGTIRT